jgi:hypothetical protein
MTKWIKVLFIVFLLALFFIPTLIAIKYVAIWQIYQHFVTTVSDLTGLNQYLVTAAAILLFIPFYIGIQFLFSIHKRRRYAGGTILLTLAILYNLGLYYFTKDIYFSFSQGKAVKWYALTPEGVRFYDRPGKDPKYGIPLRPVTPEIVRKLELLRKGGEFKPIDPSRATFFNPITGEPQVWYYRYPDGTFEFYDKPGFHPVTGTPLQPVTQEVYFEWKKTQEVRLLREPGERPPTGTQSPEIKLLREPDERSPARTQSSAVVEVWSDPQGADTYLDWKPIGPTPVRFEGKEISGLLVVVKDGYRTAFKRIAGLGEGRVAFTLTPEHKRPRTRLLLVVEDPLGEAFAELRGHLVKEGFSVLGPEEAQEFQRELRRAGGLSHRGFRAWARARFDTDLLVTAKFRRFTQELGDQELGYPGVREAVKGVVRAEVTVDLEVIDLWSGDHLAAVSGKGSGFALDFDQSVQQALTQAATESAKLLRQRLQG